MESRPCTPEDLRAIHAQPSQYQQLLNFADVLAQQREMFAKQAWTLWDGETPVAAFGVIEAFLGVFEAWAYLGEEALKQPRALARWAKRGIAVAAVTFPCRRIQAFCVTELREGRTVPLVRESAFLSFLGFRQEGVLRCYGPNGEDMAIFGWVGSS